MNTKKQNQANNNNEISVLSISSKYIHDCNNISLILKEKGIIANVSSNQTIQKDEHRYAIHRGCRIMFTETKPEVVVNQIWPHLKEKFFLGCAYFKVKNSFSGCINNYNKNLNLSKYSKP